MNFEEQGKKIDELKNNPSLNSWAQIGHPLHNDRTTCAFCNNEISDQRRKELANHFDEETDKLRDRISKGIKYLDKLLSNSPLNFVEPELFETHLVSLIIKDSLII